ncbi:MAG TPA: phospho-N-acetylmuramoyl-pentapeptide-transferase [Candidatus Dormibacteraeota bacterium]
MIQDLLTFAVTFAVAIALYPPFIRLLKRRRAGQVIQAELPEAHQRKAGTPTAGGILFTALALVGGALAWRAGHAGAAAPLVGLAAGGLIGLADDLRKLRVGSLGIPARAKFPLQLLLAVPVAYLAHNGHQWPIGPDLGAWYWPVAVVAIAGTANAVNISDGIDGLCAGLSIIALLALLFGVPNAQPGEKATGLVLLGGVAAFLVYNRHPARVFMGDAGALAIGYAIAAMAIAQGYVLALLIAGFVFEIETLSVIIQVAYFKATKGRRVFKMTPIHLTFQLEGWSENRIALSFWSAAAVAGLLAAGATRWL